MVVRMLSMYIYMLFLYALGFYDYDQAVLG